jgi:hypothetical protein
LTGAGSIAGSTEIVNDQGSACLRQGERVLSPDAATTTRDNRDLSV